MGVPPDSVSCINSATNLPAGLFLPSNGPDPPGVPVDAVLVSLNSNLAPLSVWGRSVTSKATTADIFGLKPSTPLWVLGRRDVPQQDDGTGGFSRTGPVAAHFQGILPQHDFPYPDAGTSFSFQDTIEYSADVHGGDSGSALIDSSGKLYGMHFFGTNEFGYALSAPTVFAHGVFSIDIGL
jgi:hypothetical protein